MKPASGATLAILATGQFYYAELYQIDIMGGSTYRFTSADAPVTVGGNTYNTGLIFIRDQFTQKTGLEVNTINITVAPQVDNPAGAVTISGVPFLQAVAKNVFDGAKITIYKLFLSSWSDTSPGPVKWFYGEIGEIISGRLAATFTVNSIVQQLDIMMPRNVWQTGCTHDLYDAYEFSQHGTRTGCTLNEVTFTVSGATSGSPTAGSFATNLTQVDGYFNLGRIKFTSGVNNGVTRVVKSYVNASGVVTLSLPFPSAPAAADTFTIVPGCLKTQAACSNNNSAVGPAFNNLAHFRGYPYIPNPETPYDGGVTQTQPAPANGGQSSSIIGSGFSSGNANTYQP